MPQMSQVLRERAIGMLTAGMSTRAAARELNVHLSTISHLQRRFREFNSTSKPASQPQTTCNHTSPGPPHTASSPPRSSETSHPDSCCHPLSMFGMLWISVYDSVFQFLPISNILFSITVNISKLNFCVVICIAKHFT